MGNRARSGNIIVPQGAQGPQGYQGTQGNTGAQGAIGSQGDQGYQGFQGVTGAQGVQGYQGEVGNTGPQGDTGAQGVQGAVGAQGPQGFQGYQGFQGDQGADSTVPGPQGYQGYQGEVGAQGNQGFQGVQGAQGTWDNSGVQYSHIHSSLVGRSTDNDGGWDFNANGIVDAAFSSNTTVTFSNLKQNKTLVVKLVTTNAPTITLPSYVTTLDGSADPSENGTYWLYFHCLKDTASSEEVLLSISKAAS